MPIYEIEIGGKRYQSEAANPTDAYRQAETVHTGVEQGRDLTGTNIARTVVEGMPVTGGMMQSLGAAVQAATQPWLGRGSDAPTYRERVGENLARNQARSAAFEQVNPWTAKAAQLGGGMLGTIPLLAAPELLGVTAPAALEGTMASWPARMALGGTTNQALYAADAATRGAPITREGLATSAALGAGLPGVAGVLGAGTRLAEAFPEQARGIGGMVPSAVTGLLGLHFGDPTYGLASAGAGWGLKNIGEHMADWLAQRASKPPLAWPYSAAGIAGPQLNQPQTPYGAQ